MQSKGGKEHYVSFTRQSKTAAPQAYTVTANKITEVVQAARKYTKLQNQQPASYTVHRKEQRGFNLIYANKHCPGFSRGLAELIYWIFKFLSTVLRFDVKKPTFDKCTLFTIFFIKSL